jgi:hypothetical protein
MNNRRRNSRGRVTPVRPVPVTDQLEAIRRKFARLRELDAEINRLRNVYRERDALMEELLPTFIQETGAQFVINREVTIGTQTYRFNPYFFDQRRGRSVPKVWKSCAFETGSIE